MTMDSNILDAIFASVQRTWVDAAFTLTPPVLLTALLALILPFLCLFVLALTQREAPLPPPSGCRKLGIQGISNLSDQYSKKYDEGGEASPSNPWTVKALFIYPFKSCAPQELDKTEIVKTGLKYDRQFTLAQYVTGLPKLDGKVKSEWAFITQRTFPRLSKVKPEIWIPDPEAPGYKEDGEWIKSEGCVVVRFPFTPDVDSSIEGLKNYGKILAAKLAGQSEPMNEFRLPFNPTKERIRKMAYAKETVKVWDERPVAYNMACEIPEDALAKLKYTIGVTNPLTLFRIDGEGYREVYGNAPTREDVGFQTVIGMQDSYPMHIMNLASVHHVSSSLPRSSPSYPLSALRYRPNILFTGPPPFAEDSWTKARIGAAKYHISCRTTRCKLPNVDPSTGIADRNEPGTTMRKYRVIDKGSKSACLGMQVCPLDVGGEGWKGLVSVGDEVEVLSTGEHFHRS